MVLVVIQMKTLFSIKTQDHKVWLIGATPGFNFNIPYGENFNGENTSSFSLQTGTQPGGNDENYEIVFPEGSYIFTMSDFDTGRFNNGRTEFGLYTTYGDYVAYDFENQDGSGENPVTIDYIDANYDNTSIDVYEYAWYKMLMVSLIFIKMEEELIPVMTEDLQIHLGVLMVLDIKELI